MLTILNGYERTWWKEAVVYQVYPRSFLDGNGDGIGDLRGLLSKLDYLQQLGVDVIWLSPHYDSPNADNGYDIRDYRAIGSEYGTMADFDRLLAGVRERGMRLLVDLVVNHTSDEHRWFQESRLSRSNPYRDFYFWREGKPNPEAPHGFDPPNNYRSFFSGSAWEFDPRTEQFYLHLFGAKQPDLNWDNPRVREEVYSLMRFWLDKGVDGFRMDVIPLISKPAGLVDLPSSQLGDSVAVLANGPRRDEYLQEMHREVLAHRDVMTVGEAVGISLAQTPELVARGRHELNMIFNFDAVRLNREGLFGERPWTLPELKGLYREHARVLGPECWDTIYLSNHDNPRMVSNFGDDSPPYRAASAKLLLTMLLTLRGTPFLYQGDELGMTNYPFRMDEFDDIEIKNAYQALVGGGKITEAAFLEGARRFGRDNARTPMQWTDAPNAGFAPAGARPWLPVNPNFETINAGQQEADPGSVLEYTRRLLALRRAHLALVYGEYTDLDPEHPQVYAFTRALEGERLLVVLNFSRDPVLYTLAGGVEAGEWLLGNMPSATGPPAGTVSRSLQLQPWEARLYGG